MLQAPEGCSRPRIGGRDSRCPDPPGNEPATSAFVAAAMEFFGETAGADTDDNPLHAEFGPAIPAQAHQHVSPVDVPRLATSARTSGGPVSQPPAPGDRPRATGDPAFGTDGPVNRPAAHLTVVTASGGMRSPEATCPPRGTQIAQIGAPFRFGDLGHVADHNSGYCSPDCCSGLIRRRPHRRAALHVYS